MSNSYLTSTKKSSAVLFFIFLNAIASFICTGGASIEGIGVGVGVGGTWADIVFAPENKDTPIKLITRANKENVVYFFFL